MGEGYAAETQTTEVLLPYSACPEQLIRAPGQGTNGPRARMI